MYKEGFASRLKKAREDMGVNQTRVEDDTKIKQSRLSKYENGVVEPDLETLGILADYYEVSVDWLLGTKKQNNCEK